MTRIVTLALSIALASASADFIKSRAQQAVAQLQTAIERSLR